MSDDDPICGSTQLSGITVCQLAADIRSTYGLRLNIDLAAAKLFLVIPIVVPAIRKAYMDAGRVGHFEIATTRSTIKPGVRCWVDRATIDYATDSPWLRLVVLDVAS